jgi:hypothetical protein
MNDLPSKGMPLWVIIVFVVCVIVLPTVVFLVTSYKPTKRYGKTNQAVRRTVTGFVKAHNPVKPITEGFGWIGRRVVVLLPEKKEEKEKLTTPKTVPEPKVDKGKQQSVKQKSAAPTEQRVQKEKTPYPVVHYAQDCGDYTLGDKYKGDYVSFIITPFYNEETGKVEYYLHNHFMYDPYIDEVKRDVGPYTMERG